MHSWFGVALMLVIVGTAFTLTEAVDAAVLVQPVVVLVTVRLYTPPAAVTEAVNEGETAVEV